MNNGSTIKKLYFNNKAEETLVSLISDGRLPHTMIVEGEKGSGKKTFALNIASAIVCKSENKPCGNCNNCKKVFAMIHPDVQFIEGEGKQKTISVDKIRQMRSDANVLPNDSENKVYIIVDAQNMNREAQNAALKLIEEPPSFAYFILLCENREQLLETVVSRTFPFSLKVPTIEECNSYLTENLTDKKAEEIYFAANVANGNIGKAIEVLQNPDMQKKIALIESIALAIVSKNEYGLLCSFSEIEKSKDNADEILDGVKQIFSEAFLIKNGVKLENSVADEISSAITALQISKVIDIIDSGKRALFSNVNKATLVAFLCSQISESL